LREKIGPDEADPEGFGDPKVEGENEVWPDFIRNPKGRGGFFRSLRLSSLKYAGYVALLVP
jgi:hypothetical protein